MQVTFPGQLQRLGAITALTLVVAAPAAQRVRHARNTALAGPAVALSRPRAADRAIVAAP